MAAQTTDALNVLLEALPTEQATSIEQQFSITPTPSSFSTIISSATTSSSQTSQTSSQATSTSSTSSSPSSSIFSISTSASSASISPSSTDQAAPSAAPQTSKSAGAIAGIVVGSVVGAALVIGALILLLCCLRRRRGTSRNGSGRSSLLGSIGRRREKVYPEVAWLYDPVRPASRDARPSQDPIRLSMAVPRPSEESVPRMGANAPWSSRPSTGNDQIPGQTPYEARDNSGLPYITQQSPLGPSMFQPPRDRSTSQSQAQGYYAPTGSVPQEDEFHEEVISPLLPAPAQANTGFHREPVPFSAVSPPMQSASRFGGDHTMYSAVSPPAQRQMHSAMRSHTTSPQPDSRTPMISNFGFSSNTGRAF